MATHELDCRFGERSPLAAIEAAGARVLLLGAGFESCTCLHLAETRIPGAPTEQQSCSVSTPDGPAWVTYTDIVAEEDDFAELGAPTSPRPAPSTPARSVTRRRGCSAWPRS